MGRIAAMAVMAVAVCDHEKGATAPDAGATSAPVAGAKSIRVALAHAGDRLQALAVREDASETCPGLAKLVAEDLDDLDQLSARAPASDFDQLVVNVTAALKLALAKKCGEQVTNDLSMALADLTDAQNLAKRNPEPKQAAICAKLIGCTDALVPGTGSSMQASYGPKGACWKSRDARDACTAACEQAMEGLQANAAFRTTPACQR